MVGKKASADGSVITSHTCDGNYRNWMDIVKGHDYGHDTTAIVVKGRMHTDHSTGERGMKTVGEVPVGGKTYSFLNTAYPCLNERQLGIGETTIGGRKELENKKGMFLIEELERLALQHCVTAREAIRFMGNLAETYGYGDSGECLTVADPKEVWQFEIFGAGPDTLGAVWAAVRIPDDHVGVSANISRISELDLSRPDWYMASDNVKDVARKMGFWDGQEPFKFWKAYSGTNYFNEPKAYSVRELFILNKIAPSLGLHDGLEELPLSVKPENRLSVEDVIELLAETYEGTDLDMTRNLKIRVKGKDGQMETVTSPVANPWMSGDMIKLLNAIKDSTVVNVRNVSVPQCAYSTVIQLRDWLPDDVGGVAWISLDNPGQSPRIPVFAGVTDLPDSWKIDGQLRYDENAAVWNFRRANKLATVRWGQTKDEMTAARRRFIEKGNREMPFVTDQYSKILKEEGSDKARQYLTDYTADFAGAASEKWRELGNRYWSRFARGF
ncbi:MAG: C69 family dipeptidase [Paramuribaculum sp.]|nr:C69 family dipeptidase [Paramuribaculum sp.]